MKITCDIIKDLLPLYAEGLASVDTVELVAEHISTCENCKEVLNEMSSTTPIPFDSDAAPLKKIRAALQKQRVVTVLLSVLVSLVVAITVFGFLTSPSYIPYVNDVVSVIEQGNGTVMVQFGDSVSGFDTDKYVPEDGEYGDGFYYHITAWDSVWNHWFKGREPLTIVLNPDGSKVERIYYYQANGEEDVLIYGQQPSGGVVTLPSHVLTSYIVIALVLAIICGIAIFLTRKNKKAQKAIIYIELIPIAYIIASICIVASRPISYFAARDFFLIMLIALPVYGLLWLILNSYRKSRRIE